MAHFSRQVDVYGWLFTLGPHIRSNFRFSRSFSNHRHLLLHHVRQHVLSLLSNSFSMFITLRFFQAFGRAGITTTGYVLIREIVGSEHQTMMGLAIQGGWSIGFVTLVGVAWFFRNWFWLQLVIAVSFIPIVFAFGIISESPRWLLTRGKTTKLERLLTKAAAINGRKVKDDEIKGFTLLNNKRENENKHSATLLEVLRMPKMRKRLLIMIYVWIVNVSLYYAFSYNISDLAGNIYLNFFIAGLVEFPCYVMVYWASSGGDDGLPSSPHVNGRTL
ncbi:solute carrier family 22 member 3 [Trichonephila clavata]|uniref:Solute carrier family 22 member 3 n=1 Tax=Trichonephila clavata TaxID=2740835 RepID=A0A8X6H1I0_TRICU|nr:solute carrier family 22 member 3 [Trichonephila clavata]